MPVNPKDPDASLVPLFKNHAIPNTAKSAKAGRPIFDDMEVCEIRIPGSRDVKVVPATAFSDWTYDQFTGEQIKRTYAERFASQYRQFKMKDVQTKAGTPLEYVPFLTEGKRAELKALNVYTIEALAHIDGQELKNLGLGGRELKNQAVAFLEDTSKTAPSSQMAAELEALKARNQILEEDNKALAARRAMQEKAKPETPPFGNAMLDLEALKARNQILEEDYNKALAARRAMQEKAKSETPPSGNAMLDAMSDPQLKEYIKSQTGGRVLGNPARKTLLRMAVDATPKLSEADQVA
jgi:hypothetical protein